MTVQDKFFTHPQSTFDPIGWHSGTPFPLWLTWRETLSHKPENVEDDSKWSSLTKPIVLFTDTHVAINDLLPKLTRISGVYYKG